MLQWLLDDEIITSQDKPACCSPNISSRKTQRGLRRAARYCRTIGNRDSLRPAADRQRGDPRRARRRNLLGARRAGCKEHAMGGSTLPVAFNSEYQIPVDDQRPVRAMRLGRKRMN
ncbi:hypothetical protein ACS8Y6_17705 [Salinisphaera sp. RV14]|uniref:hypothetical protein n=1 Tax=unclassified Salinisphaera TaxID=2649847 RepID=UPI003F85E6BC